MKRLFCSVTLGLVAVPASSQSPEPAINLVCPGVVGKDQATTTTILTNKGVAVASSEGRASYGDTVNFRLTGNSGVARLPKKMMPTYREGGEDGWYPVIDLVRRADEITGRVRFHAMYKPRFRLDRITGQVTVSGNLGDFAGTCESYDPQTVERKF